MVHGQHLAGQRRPVQALVVDRVDEEYLRTARPFDGCVTVTIDRPAAKNAMTLAMWSGLRVILEQCEDDATVRVVTITGVAGAFVAGSDVTEIARRTWRDAFRAEAQRTVDTVRRASFATIASVNGWALGGGCELATACDIMLVSTTAVLGHPEIRHGIIPGAGATQMLVQRIGHAHALDLVLTGRRISADEAVSLGLAHSVHEPDQLAIVSEDLARRICSSSPVATSMAIAAFRAGTSSGDAGLIAERLAQTAVFAVAAATANPTDGKAEPDHVDR